MGCDQIKSDEKICLPADYEHQVDQESGTGELRITPSSVLAAATGTAGESGA
jgi:hypothetical protein